MRQRVRSGSPFEARYGFCRALRVGSRVLVAGTAPIEADGGCALDAYSQAQRCFAIITAALLEAGARPDQVVRTRMYITDPADQDRVGEAHREAVGPAAPAATMVVVAALLDPRWKVEIEAEADLT